MRKLYKRTAYYLDDGILLKGYKDKYGFHPCYGLECGFGLQKLCKKDIGSNVFYSLKDVIAKLGNVEVAGLKLSLTIDGGDYHTKIVYKVEDLTGM